MNTDDIRFPNHLCHKCKQITMLLKADPPVNGKDSKCENCGNHINNYLFENGKIKPVSYDAMLALVKKSRH